VKVTPGAEWHLFARRGDIGDRRRNILISIADLMTCPMVYHATHEDNVPDILDAGQRYELTQVST